VPAFPGFMAAARDPDLGVDLRRLLHMGEEHTLVRPVRPGDVLRVAWTLESVDHLDNGDAFTVVATEATVEGEPVAEVRGRMFVRGGGRAPERPPPDRPAPVHEHRVRVEDDQMQRYAEASGDRNPIHLDARAARLAGLRRPILHGMCTMAMATAGAVDGLAGGHPTRVARVAVAFARPVVPGQELTTRYWLVGEERGTTRYGFETVTGEGARVIDDAEVEIRG
jgi:acyl dehydratase